MKPLDYLVVGAGPAGLQLGYFMEKACRDYVILEAGPSIATFFRRYPRSRRLISFNRPPLMTDDPEIRLRFDWNSLLGDEDAPVFRDLDSSSLPNTDKLVLYLEAFANHHNIKVQYDTKAVAIEKDGDLFTITNQDGETYTTSCLIVASGTRPYTPPIPGIEHVTEDYSNVSMEPRSYEGQRVLVIGKGNSAFEILNVAQETAAIVNAVSPRSLRLAWNTRHSGHVRSSWANPLDLYQLKLVQSILFNATVDLIEIKEGGVFEVTVTFTRAEGETETFLYDRVINCTGFCFDGAMFAENTQPALTINDRLPALTSTWESTNTAGLYFAGTLTQSIDFRRAASAFIGGFRYNAKTLFALLEEQYHGIALGSDVVPRDSEVLARDLSVRMTHSSALFLQFGFLGDALVLEDGQLRCYRELPAAYIKERFRDAPLCITLTLEWGTYEGDVFAIPRKPEAQYAEQSAFIHPIVRVHRKGVHVDELHLVEDLYTVYCVDGHDKHFTKTRADLPLSEWHKRHHVDPLEAVLRKHLMAN